LKHVLTLTPASRAIAATPAGSPDWARDLKIETALPTAPTNLGASS
jgi:hypothetical protein